MPRRPSHSLLSLTNLRPGKYELTAELSGFRSYRQSLALRVGEDLTVSFTKRLAGINTSVEVVSQFALIVDNESVIYRLARDSTHHL